MRKEELGGGDPESLLGQSQNSSVMGSDRQMVNPSLQSSMAVMGAMKALQAEVARLEQELSAYKVNQVSLEAMIGELQSKLESAQFQCSKKIETLQIQAENNMKAWLTEESRLQDQISRLMEELDLEKQRALQEKAKSEATHGLLKAAKLKDEKEKAEGEKRQKQLVSQHQLEREKMAVEHQAKTTLLQTTIDQLSTELRGCLAQAETQQGNYKENLKELKKKFEKKIKGLEASNMALQGELKEEKERNKKALESVASKHGRHMALCSEAQRKQEAEISQLKEDAERRASELQDCLKQLQDESENTQK